MEQDLVAMLTTSKMVFCVGAAYALTLTVTTPMSLADCEATEAGQISASDGQPGIEFGTATAVSGNTILVGAPQADGQSGAAYIYEFDGSSWIEAPKLVPSDGALADRCGFSVAIDGDVAVIGAPQHLHTGILHSFWEGSAYVLRFNGSSWVEEQELLASNIAAGQSFGWSVAVHNDVIVVGAVGVGNHGAAYIFRYNGASWDEEAIVTASDGDGGDFFGWSVAVEGSVALVGAIRDHDDALEDSGSAYVYRHQGGLVWDEEAKLTASDAAAEDMLGASVALSGNVALVAANNANADWDTGAAYIFRYNGTSWPEEQKLTAPAETPDPSEFAFAVALEGNIALVSAVRDDAANTASGSAYIFVYDGETWNNQAKLMAASGTSDDLHSWSVGLSGDLAVVGAMGADANEGTAYTYDGLTDGMPDECQSVTCPWDLDDDQGVGITDFLTLLGAWGTNPGGPPDFDGDLDVGITDFLALLANWGACP